MRKKGQRQELTKRFGRAISKTSSIGSSINTWQLEKRVSRPINR